MTTETEKKMLKEKIRIIPHKNNCSMPIIDKGTKNVIICCGDDLGGNNNEFYQCPECRDKDFQEYWTNEGYQLAQKENQEIILLKQLK